MKLYILLCAVIACTLIFTACSTTPEKTTESVTSATEISTSDTDNCYAEVDNALSDLCKSDEFKNATDDEKAELGMSTLKNLEEKGLIMQDSIDYNSSDNSSISFRYANGAKGAFVLKEFDERLN